MTWDVDSANRAQCARLRRFVFGYATRSEGRTYRYPGFLDLDGVRYVGQSVLFVAAHRLEALRAFLAGDGIEHVVVEAWMGKTVSR